MAERKHVVVAPAGDSLEALFVGIREFPTERVILIAAKEDMQRANQAKKDLERFKIPCQIKEVKDSNKWEGVFKAIGDVAQLEKDVLVNAATGDKNTQCAATCAAFVNGLKAFSVEGNTVMLLPVLKFSYYKILTDKKIQLLKIINQKDCCASLDELSKKAKMSLPLVSYHINGNLKSEGLVDLGLVEVTEKKGRMAVALTPLGRLLIQGYVK